MAITVSVEYSSNPTSLKTYLIYQIYTKGSLGTVYTTNENSSYTINTDSLSSWIGIGERTIGTNLYTGGFLAIASVEAKFYYSGNVLMDTQTLTGSSDTQHCSATASRYTVYELAQKGIEKVVFKVNFGSKSSFQSLTNNSTTDVSVVRGTTSTFLSNALTTNDFTLTQFIPNKTGYYSFTSTVSGDDYVLTVSPDPWAILYDSNLTKIDEQDGGTGDYISGIKNNFRISQKLLTAGYTYYLYIGSKAYLTDDILVDSPKVYAIPVKVDQYFNTTIKNSNSSLGSVSSTGSFLVHSASGMSVTATPNAGCEFVGWTNSSGSTVSTSKTYTLYPSTNGETYTANFKKIIYTVSVQISPGSSYGSVSLSSNGILPVGQYYYQDTVTLEAHPLNIRSKFLYWEDVSAGNIINDNGTKKYAFQITSNKSFYAYFGDNKYTVSYDAFPGYNPPSSQTEYAGTSITIKDAHYLMYKDQSQENGGTIYFNQNTPSGSAYSGSLDYYNKTAINTIDYIFDYWVDKSNTSKIYFAGDLYTDYKDLELKAQWEPYIESYGKVSFPNGTLNGYTLAGFSKNPNSLTPDSGCYPGTSLEITPDLYGQTYYAIWRQNNYILKISKYIPESDTTIWIRDKKVNETEYGNWQKITQTGIGYDSPTHFQYYVESGELYQFDSTKQAELYDTKTENLINNFVPSYSEIFLEKETTLLIFNKPIKRKDSIYVGNSKQVKSKGYIKFPHSNLDKNIESIWIGNTQVLGKISSEEYYPYLYNTIAEDSFYVGANESSLNNSSISNKNVKKIIFPKQWSITYLTDSTFLNCSDVTEIILPNNLIMLYNASIFEGCSSLETICLPDSIEYIGHSSFKDCSKLKRVIFSCKNLKVLQSASFQNCTNLSYFNLWGSLINIINQRTFEGCSSLRAISLPSTITSIEQWAFNGCDNLQRIYYNGTMEQWNNIEIKLYNTILNNATIYCKDGIINPKEEN